MNPCQHGCWMQISLYFECCRVSAMKQVNALDFAFPWGWLLAHYYTPPLPSKKFAMLRHCIHPTIWVFLYIYSFFKHTKFISVYYTVSFTGSVPQILRSLHRSNLPTQPSFWPSFRPYAVWCVSYKLLSRSWHTDLDYGLFRLLDLEIGPTAGVTGRQGMLLLPLLVYPAVRVCPILWFVFPTELKRSSMIVCYLS
jgi:hypothetical protein